MTFIHFRKPLVALALAAAVPTVAGAVPGLTLGVKGGMALSTTSEDGASNGTGWLAGLGADFGMGPLGVMIDLLYGQRAYGFPGSTEVKLTQLFVPIQARYSIIPMLHLSAGGYFSTGFGNVKGSVLGVPFDQPYSTFGISKSDFGATAGLGLSLPLGVTTLSLEARYNLGLKDTGGGTKIRSIDLLAGVTF
jgi:hypothetical protein